MATIRQQAAAVAAPSSDLSSVDFTGGSVSDPAGAVTGNSLGDGSAQITTDGTAHQCSSNQQVQVTAGSLTWDADWPAFAIEATLSDPTAWANSAGIGIGVAPASGDGLVGWAFKNGTGNYAAVATPDSGGHVLNTYAGTAQATAPTKVRVIFSRAAPAGVPAAGGTMTVQILDADGTTVLDSTDEQVTFGTITQYMAVYHDGGNAKTVGLTDIVAGAWVPTS